MGDGSPKLLRAYEDGEVLQCPLPPIASETVNDLSESKNFLSRMVKIPEYTNFLSFFEQEIEAKGWKAVINEYCFNHTAVSEAIFAQLFEGLYHLLIYLGFGVGFDQSSIVAEGLAQAASQNPGLTFAQFFKRGEQFAGSGTVKSKPLIELYAEI